MPPLWPCSKLWGENKPNSAPQLESAPDGRVLSALGVSDTFIDMVLLPDGKFVVLSQAFNSTVVLSRFNADGSLATSFGTGGKSTATVSDTYFTDLALQADGRLVAGAAIRAVRPPILSLRASPPTERRRRATSHQALSGTSAPDPMTRCTASRSPPTARSSRPAKQSSTITLIRWSRV